MPQEPFTTVRGDQDREISPRAATLHQSIIEAMDAQASIFMKRGIHLLESDGPNSAAEAVTLFDSALELRRRLLTEALPGTGYSLAACWLNRADAMMKLPDADHLSAALHSYDEAIRLLRELPLQRDPRFPRRLAIAYQNRGLALQRQDRPDMAEASRAFLEAISVLDRDYSALISDRQYLFGVVWLNFANSCATVSNAELTARARDAARRAIAFVSDLEVSDANAAEVGLKARHILCQTIASILSQAFVNDGIMPDAVHEGTDAADDALILIRHWEQEGVVRFRNIACDLFAFGARMYARFQPRFLEEFVRENSRFTRSPSHGTSP
jgi:tetratricopeptide (TPR) repeat protein